MVSTNCSGPNELIGCNKYGVLCESYEDLELAILNSVAGAAIPRGIPPIVNISDTMSKIYELFW